MDGETALPVQSSVPTVWSALRFRTKTQLLQGARIVRDLREGTQRYGPSDARGGEVLLAESAGALWPVGHEANDAERALTLGKIHNLRVAARRVDGARVPAGEVFSFWKHVGRATRRSGYVAGRELREGCLVPSVGGGLCQLSNALYDAALRAGFEIVERHAHTAVVRGSLAEIGRDATVFWNYVDLRFRPSNDVRIEVALTSDSLVVRYWGMGAAPAPKRSVARVAEVAPVRPAPTGDCASCSVEDCFRHILPGRVETAAGRSAFLLDAYWPEYDAYIASVAERRDTLVLPLDGRRRGSANYRWNTSVVDEVRESAPLALLRSYQSRRMAQHGAARQRLLISWARRMANGFASKLPYDVTHVVVMQHLLPALWTGKHLGGRTYDVLMTGMPMRVVQRTLDRAYALHPESPTLKDFRVDESLLDDEDRALAGARTIFTPHAAVAASLGARAKRLPWYVPVPAERDGLRLSPRAQNTIVFPASTLGRGGAYEVRQVARELGLRVILTGPDLEDSRFWEDVSVERKSFSEALGVGPVVLPAFVENQPRRLLLAAAMGIPVVVSDACGLDRSAGIDVVPMGDQLAFSAAVARVLEMPAQLGTLVSK